MRITVTPKVVKVASTMTIKVTPKTPMTIKVTPKAPAPR